jgi:multiple sugar transport system ATP-binding protein
MAELKLVDLRKSYGSTTVIHGVDLEVRDGEFVVFVGPSGCGKSTLLRIIAGLDEATSGDILIDGRSVRGVPASDRGLAMVFQSYALYPHMRVYDNMAFALENMGLKRPEIDRRVRRAAQMLRLEDLLDRKPKAMSGGQRQRVAIGRAIVRDPKIFLFDEPLSNLDAELRVATRRELASLRATIGGTMIYVTHDQVEAMTLADRIVVLHAGRIEQVGTPLDLYNRPANQFVAGFIGSPRMNFMQTQVLEPGFLRLGKQGRKLAVPTPDTVQPGDAITLGVRPEHIRVVAGENADLTIVVDLVEQLGGETFLYGTDADLPQITLRQDGQAPAPRGALLNLALERSCLHLFDAQGRALHAR